MRKIRKRSLVFVAATLLLTGAVSTAYATTRPDPVDPLPLGGFAVATADYTLGDDAFRVPGFTVGDGDKLAPLELTGRVNYPRDLGAGKHPMVMFEHGDWSSCADRAAAQRKQAAEKRLYGPDAPQDPAEIERLEKIIDRAGGLLYRWPCAPDTPALPNQRGYDYIAKQLASHGFVVLSISLSGVNLGALGDGQDAARAAVANKHLEMWRDLVTTGKGPLAGRLPGAFRGHVDLQRVGLVGHSRGGRGVMYQSADVNQSKLPAGVRIGAVLGLEPTRIPPAEAGPEVIAAYTNTRIPSATILGTCGYGASDFFTVGKERSTAPRYLWTVHGANHNFFNTEWSPQSGQVAAFDDAGEKEPGKCGPEGKLDRKLTETQQRTVGVAYMSAFFRRYLAGDERFEAMLSGRTAPLSAVTKVDVQAG
ncbi:hypothetical protein [Actinoplanes philippinensis]|uniref:hypothetical protein n=1 Tax=Actinoplanes philippinensis TaxID=35752 RepID=UPI0033D823BA